MSLHIGDTAPDFSVKTTTGEISLHDWAGDSWVFFFSHPADFTPVCTTEMGMTARLAGDFAEILRVIDSLQLSDKVGVVTPADWQPGGDVIIPPSVSDADAVIKFPQGFKTIKPYLRTTTVN